MFWPTLRIFFLNDIFFKFTTTIHLKSERTELFLKQITLLTFYWTFLQIKYSGTIRANNWDVETYWKKLENTFYPRHRKIAYFWFIKLVLNNWLIMDLFSSLCSKECSLVFTAKRWHTVHCNVRIDTIDWLPLKKLSLFAYIHVKTPFLRLHDQVIIVFTFFPYSTWHKALPKVLRHVLGMIKKCLATSCCCQSWCSLKMGYQKCTSRRCCHQKLCHIFFDWQHLWWIHRLYKWQLIKVRFYFLNIDLFQRGTLWVWIWPICSFKNIENIFLVKKHKSRNLATHWV